MVGKCQSMFHLKMKHWAFAAIVANWEVPKTCALALGIPRLLKAFSQGKYVNCFDSVLSSPRSLVSLH